MRPSNSSSSSSSSKQPFVGVWSPVEKKWLQRLITGCTSAKGKPTATIKVAAVIIAHTTTRRRFAELSDELIRHHCGISMRSLQRAKRLLHREVLISVVKPSDCPNRLSPGFRRYVINSIPSRDDWFKIYKLHVKSEWFQEATPSVVQTWFAHCVRSGPLGRLGGFGHWTSMEKVAEIARQPMSTFKANTAWLNGRAFRIGKRPLASGLQGNVYRWIMNSTPAQATGDLF